MIEVPEVCDDYAPDTLNPVEEDRGICTTCFFQGEDHDPIKRVAAQSRAEEARFIVEHDGSSSAEYYGEGGTNDHMDEMSEAEKDEAEADYCRARGGP